MRKRSMLFPCVAGARTEIVIVTDWQAIFDGNSYLVGSVGQLLDASELAPK